MNWLDRLEKHLGFLAIPNLILGVIAGQALMTLAALQNPTLPLLLQLDPIAVTAGQWYRLLTWVLVPATGALGVFFAIFWFWFLWMVGRTLEQDWGVFRCSLYLMLGVALPALGSMVLWYYFGIHTVQTGLYFSIALQLAFAAVAPDFTLYFFFVLPVKMRWWAWALGAWLLYRALSGGWAGAFEVAFGVGNYLIFFLPLAISAARQRKQVAQHRQVFTSAQRDADAERLALHRCAQCNAGREAELRLCTCERCGDDGRFWCAEHLGPHLEPPEEPPKKIGRVTKSKTKRKG